LGRNTGYPGKKRTGEKGTITFFWGGRTDPVPRGKKEKTPQQTQKQERGGPPRKKKTKEPLGVSARNRPARRTGPPAKIFSEKDKALRQGEPAIKNAWGEKRLGQKTGRQETLEKILLFGLPLGTGGPRRGGDFTKQRTRTEKNVEGGKNETQNGPIGEGKKKEDSLNCKASNQGEALLRKEINSNNCLSKKVLKKGEKGGGETINLFHEKEKEKRGVGCILSETPKKSVTTKKMPLKTGARKRDRSHCA